MKKEPTDSDRLDLIERRLADIHHKSFGTVFLLILILMAMIWIGINVTELVKLARPPLF